MIIGGLLVPGATASHEPANKVAAAGSDVESVDGEEVVLSETVKISSPFDLMLQLTAECSIITELSTGGDAADSSSAFGSVRMHVEIDGTPVPVASDDTNTAGEDDVTDNDSTIGEVTFCNRAYGRSVEDTEGDGDVDREDDYIRTRTANAFNWLALDVGFLYDKPLEGQQNNEVLIEVIADYDTAETGDAIADAFVGSRTLIAEPTNASVHEAVEPQGGEGS